MEAPDGKADRRIPRTQSMLQHALIALIQKTDCDSITITDICEEADVSRSTFYAHFSSKDDLKRAGLHQLRRLLVAQQKAVPTATFGFSLTLFEHARDHLSHYQALAGGAEAPSRLQPSIRSGAT